MAMLLATKRRHDDVAFGRNAPRLQVAHDEKRRGDPRETVVVAAVEHAVGVTAAKEARKRPIAPGKTHEQIARRVAGGFESERPSFLFQGVEHAVLHLRIAQARHAPVRSGRSGERADFGKKRLRIRAVRPAETGKVRRFHGRVPQ